MIKKVASMWKFNTGWWAVALLLFANGSLPADQVEMQNGDRYFGKVISLNADKLVLESDTLGTVLLTRGKVASITFGPGLRADPARAHQAPVSVPPASTNRTITANPGPSTILGHLDTNTVQQIQAQFLAGAGPEANNKFNELLSGLLTGKLTVRDIRVQAKSAVDQIRAMKRDLGNDAGESLDGYLAILDQFLNESDPATGTGPADAANPGNSLSKPKQGNAPQSQGKPAPTEK